MNPLFFNLIYFLATCLSNILVNLTGLPSIISTWGLHPVHCKGITIGEGLSLIITINSSLNFWGVSGNAQTLISTRSLGFWSICLSWDSWKISFLYSELFYIIVDFSENYNCVGNGPWFASLNIEELIFMIDFYWRLAGFLPINNGPKSNTFSDWT